MGEKIEAQAEELEALRRQVPELGQRNQPPGGDDAVDGEQAQPGDWRPTLRGPGMPDAGVVTLEEHPDEAHAFGPGGAVGGRVAGGQDRDGKQCAGQPG